jgi:hypothetical protein
MTVALSPDQTRRLRIRAQWLHAPAFRQQKTATQTVAALCGFQAQDLKSAILAVGVRNRALVADDVEVARETERSIVRTWCMRGTLHLIATEDLGWLLAFLGLVFIRADQRRRNQLGLTEDICARATKVIRDALGKRGALTRPELARLLTRQGIPTRGQALYHLLYRAGLDGVLCYGPNKADEPAFVSLEDWVTLGAAMGESQALAEFTHRYLAAYGPAGPEDMAAWSGLPISSARTGFDSVRAELLEVEFDGAPAWMLQSHAAWLDEPFAGDAVVRLLPPYDPYVLGYASRDLIVSRQYVKRIHPGGGIIHPTVVADGRAVGTWKMLQSRKDVHVTVEPFERLNAEVTRAIEGEVRELGRFYGMQASLGVATSANED